MGLQTFFRTGQGSFVEMASESCPRQACGKWMLLLDAESLDDYTCICYYIAILSDEDQKYHQDR
jgi:hypothetical protein